LEAAAEAVARHAAAAADLDVVAPGKIERLVARPPRHVEVHAAGSVLVVRWGFHQPRNEAGDREARRISEVPAERAARVRQSLRMLRGPRVEHDARGLAGARREDDDARAD